MAHRVLGYAVGDDARPFRVRERHGGVRDPRDAVARRLAGPGCRRAAASRGRLVHAQGLRADPRLHVDPRDVATPAHRSADELLLEGPHSGCAREHPRRGGPLARIPGHARARGDRELDPPDRIRRRTAAGPATAPGQLARARASLGAAGARGELKGAVTFDFVEPIVFAVLSIGVIGAGAAVVLINRITAAALLMALTFLCMAGMFVLLGAETIAAFQVLIYVGAITVLILYGVMFTKYGDRPYGLFFQRQTPLAAVFVFALAVPVAYWAFFFTSPPPRPGGGDLPSLATSVFTDFAFPFEIASVLLLAAMVGAIVLTKRDDPEEAALPRRP